MSEAEKQRRDPRVDTYLEALPPWQRELGEELRELIHSVDPEIEETIKRRVRPYFILEGNVCALLAAKNHLNLFLYDGGIVPDPEGIITGGHENKTARTVAFGEPRVRGHVLAVDRHHDRHPLDQVAEAVLP